MPMTQQATNHRRLVTPEMLHELPEPVQRYRENKGAFTLDTWSTPMTQYGVLAGLNLPVRGQAVWKLPSGDLPYADLMLDSIEYNVPIPSIGANTPVAQ